jgi:tartrate dehydratase beta subunit/fumarate hydratase class I family protein
MNGMGTSEECAAAAALAFRHICDGIYSELVFECICELYVQCLPLRMLTSCLGELQ